MCPKLHLDTLRICTYFELAILSASSSSWSSSLLLLLVVPTTTQPTQLRFGSFVWYDPKKKSNIANQNDSIQEFRTWKILFTQKFPGGGGSCGGSCGGCCWGVPAPSVSIGLSSRKRVSSSLVTQKNDFETLSIYWCIICNYNLAATCLHFPKVTTSQTQFGFTYMVINCWEKIIIMKNILSYYLTCPWTFW